MISVDTNILVRIVTNDEPEQAQCAANVFCFYLKNGYLGIRMGFAI